MAKTAEPLRVLLVAPHSSEKLPLLPWVDVEIEAIVNSGLLVRLEREVNERRLIELTSNQAYDIIWFASHGTSEGVFLSDGLLKTDALTAILRNSGAHHVVLNTCDSVHVAASISEETSADVICTVTEIGDRQAWRTAALLATNLARGLSIQAAYKKARPTLPGKYVYLPGMSNGAADERQELKNKIAELTTTLAAASKQDASEQAIAGIALIAVGQDKLEGRVEIIEAKLSPPASAVILIALTIILFIANLLIVYDAVSDPVVLEVLKSQPLIAILTEIVVLFLCATWIFWAYGITRKHVYGDREDKKEEGK